MIESLVNENKLGKKAKKKEKLNSDYFIIVLLLFSDKNIWKSFKLLQSLQKKFPLESNKAVQDFKILSLMKVKALIL